MKTKILLLFFPVVPFISFAQPQLTASNTNPVIGESYSASSVTYFSPGPGGANQTWNWASVSSGGSSASGVVSSSSTPYAASFPSANIAIDPGGGSYVYYSANASAYQYYGLGTSSVIQSLSNPEDQLRYPFTYTDNYTDNWACTFVSGVTWYRTGTTTVTADGYGTLILPSGTYTNVLRVHLYQDYQDSSQFTTLTYTNDQYLWYKPGNHFPIASLFSLTTSMSGTTQGGSYANSVALGEEELSSVGELNVFPNPSNGVFTVTSSGNLPTSYEVYNLTGQKMESGNLNFIPGNIKTEIDLSFLPAGIYSLRVFSENKASIAKALIIEK